MSRLSSATLALLVLALVPLAGCAPGDGRAAADASLRVIDVTVDHPSNPQQAAVRLVIDNGSDRPDRLISVATPVAAAARVHRSQVDAQGRATMAAVDGLPVPAASKVRFSPGGLHIMLTGLRRPLELGERFDLVLTFAEAGDRTVSAVVVAPGSQTAPEEVHHAR